LTLYICTGNGSDHMYLDIYTGMFVFWSVETGKPIGVAGYEEPWGGLHCATVVTSVALSWDATSIASGVGVPVYPWIGSKGAIRRWDAPKV